MAKTRRKLEKLREYTSIEGERIKVLSGTVFRNGEGYSEKYDREINVRYGTDVTRVVVDDEVIQEYDGVQNEIILDNYDRLVEVLDDCEVNRVEPSELLYLIECEMARLQNSLVEEDVPYQDTIRKF
jgi:c-di-AMP phosphodiesterase-like protein